MLQAALAATPASPGDDGILAPPYALAIHTLLLIFSPAWVWAVYGLVSGTINCLLGYGFLSVCVAMMIVPFGGVLVFTAVADATGAWGAVVRLAGAATGSHTGYGYVERPGAGAKGPDSEA